MSTITDSTSTPTADDERDVQRTGLWRIVMIREITVKLRDRSFLIGTALMMTLLVAIIGFQAFMSNRGESYDLAVTTSDASMAETFADQVHELNSNLSMDLIRFDDPDQARNAVLTGQADG